MMALLTPSTANTIGAMGGGGHCLTCGAPQSSCVCAINLSNQFYPGGSIARAAPWQTATPEYPHYPRESYELVQRVSNRFIWSGSWIDMDRFSAFAVRLNDSRIALCLVINEKLVTIEDEARLFPSDTLMASLRLIIPETK